MNTLPRTNAAAKLSVSTTLFPESIRLRLVTLGVSLGFILVLTGCKMPDWLWNNLP